MKERALVATRRDREQQQTTEGHGDGVWQV